MNEEVKTKWLAALRSGNYTQGMKRLRTNDSFCCLGVLCDLAISEGIGDLKWSGSQYTTNDVPSDVFFEAVNENDWDAYLVPEPVVAWANLELTNPEHYVNGERQTLAALNDGGKTFEQIADVIEEYY